MNARHKAAMARQERNLKLVCGVDCQITIIAIKRYSILMDGIQTEAAAKLKAYFEQDGLALTETVTFDDEDAMTVVYVNAK